ncbi:FAD binding domain-containing protein [Coralliovum pocilloporae]|uniref:FAD binding domain-containing protein n=1 Tax=Coralliovum pocilloporae TaxID=3066369 RepID=UPI0033077817
MRFEAPQTVEAAVGLLSSEGGVTRVLSGGTDVLVQLRSGMVEPDLIVDIKKIPGMRDIVEDDEGFRIGAAVACVELGEHDALSKAWPGVVEGAELIGSTQVQGRATMVGNLCNASPAADSVPGLVAAGATVEIVGPDGRRQIKVEDVPAAPGRTSLAKGEMIEAIRLPKRAPRSGDAYLRFIPRTEMDIAVVGCAVRLALDETGTCTEASVALGAVAITVLNVKDAADALIGTKVDDEALARMAAAASAACKPIDDKRGTREFRIKIAGVLAERAARIALERARG